MFAISTAWHSDLTVHAEKLLEEILNLGIINIELESRIPEEEFCRMLPIFYEHEINVTSLHSFFPKPEQSKHSNYELGLGLAADDESVRKEVLNLHARTLDFARDMECHAVVIHLGNIPMDARSGEQFMLIEKAGSGSGEYEELRKTIAQERAGLAKGCFSNVLHSLEELNRLADEREMQIGIETRVAYNEIPSFEETKEIFSSFSGSRLKYWVDIGHAHLQAKLGWYDLDEFYSVVAGETIGVHLHDVRGFEDHYAPGSGEIDFQKAKDKLNPDMLKVVEVLSKTSERELIEGLDYIKHLGWS